jgi:hypothetical protein
MKSEGERFLRHRMVTIVQPIQISLFLSGIIRYGAIGFMRAIRRKPHAADKTASPHGSEYYD